MIDVLSPTGIHAMTPSQAWTRRQAVVSTAFVSAIWLLAALQWPLAGETVPWDAKNHFYPMFRYIGAAFADGVIPYWNPYHFSGHPTAADPQSLLFTPTMAAFAWAHPHASMSAFDAAVFAHLLVGGLATLCLFARRGWRPEGGMLAATMVMLGGVAASRLQHTGIIFSYGFIPLAMLALEMTLARPSWRWACAAGLSAGLLALGRDQVAFFGCVMLLGTAAGALITAEHRGRWLRTRLPRLLLAAAIAAAMAIPPSLLTLQFLAASNRPGIGFGFAAMGSLPPQALATWLFPNIFGTLDRGVDYWGPGPMTIDGGSWTDMSINYLFAGTLPAALLLLHGLIGGRMFARETRFFLIVLAVSSLYALGRFTPAYEWIFDTLPGVSLYRRPADAAFPANIALAVLTGYVLHRAVADGWPVLTRITPLALLRAALGIALIVTILALALRFAIPAGRTGYALIEIGLGSAVAAVGIVALAQAGDLRQRALAAALIVAITAGELVWRHAASDINAEPTKWYFALDKLPPLEAQAFDALKSDIASRHAQGQRPRIEVLGLQHGWQNAAMIHRLEDTLGYNALRLSEYEEAIGSGENAVDLRLRLFPGTFRGWRSRLASLLGLEYVVLNKPIDQMPPAYPRPEIMPEIFAAPGLYIYRLGPAAPRVYVATHLIPVDSRAVLDSDELPDFNRSSAALLDEASLPMLTGDYGVKDQTTEPGAPDARAVILAYGRNRVLVEVETDRPSVLILHDLFYPGWVATLNGTRVPILKTNLLFRGVETPRGRHIVEFRFQPLSLENLGAAAGALLRERGGD